MGNLDNFRNTHQIQKIFLHAMTFIFENKNSKFEISNKIDDRDNTE
jgi:hypothetical protein